jgi:DnaJ-domain-containing protein 1
MPSTRRQRPEVPSEEQTPSQLVKRIRKLRWMGMEDEAKRLQAALDRLEHAECVLAAPRDTD